MFSLARVRGLVNTELQHCKDWEEVSVDACSVARWCILRCIVYKDNSHILLLNAVLSKPDKSPAETSADAQLKLPVLITAHEQPISLWRDNNLKSIGLYGHHRYLCNMMTTAKVTKSKSRSNAKAAFQGED